MSGSWPASAAASPSTFEVDPTIARVLYLLGTIMTGFFPGIFIYFALALIMPEEPLNRDADDAD